MYGPMSRNRNSYGHQPFANVVESFVSPNRVQQLNRAYPNHWNSYVNPLIAGNQFTNPYQPYYAQPPQGFHPQQYAEQQPQYSTSTASYSQKVFQNPLFSPDGNGTQHTQSTFQNQQPYFHPYPKASFLAKQPTGVKTVLNSFKSQDGTLDINKMVDTAGQMMNAVNQVSSVVKGIGGIFKV